MQQTGLTSFNSLRTLGRIAAGSRVLILGGTSSTGLVAIQLAKAFGAVVIATTCSAGSAALVRKLGATEVVDYREEDVFAVMGAKKQRFDIIYDTVMVGKRGWEGAAAGALAEGGQYVTITGDAQVPLDIGDLLTRGYQIVSRNWFGFFSLGRARYHQYTQLGGESENLEAVLTPF